MKYVALLRGINVGRAKRIAMADLRAAVEAAGGSNVRTLLNSGNVVFDSRKAAASLEKGIHDSVQSVSGVSSSVIILTAAELAEALGANPLEDLATDPSRFLIAVPKSAKDRERLRGLLERDWSPDVVATGRRVAYLWCPQGILTSKLLEQLGRVLGDGVTTRNLATMRKLRGMTEAS